MTATRTVRARAAHQRIGAQDLPLRFPFVGGGLKALQHVLHGESVLEEPARLGVRLRDARREHRHQHGHRQQRIVGALCPGPRGDQEPHDDHDEHDRQAERRDFLREDADLDRHVGCRGARDVEGIHQGGGVGESRRAILEQAPIDCRRQRRRQVGAQRGERRHRLGELAHQQSLRAVARERRLAHQPEVGGEPEGVEVAASVELLTRSLLGAHELRRAHHFAHARHRRIRRAGDPARHPEVHQQRSARRALQHDVVGLDVAVHHAASVRVGERVGDVLQQAHAFARRQRAGARDTLREALALDEAHHERQHALAFLDGVHRHDVGMREARRDAGLPHEPLAQHRIGREGLRQHLDGHMAVELQVAPEVDGAHAAAPELALHRIAVAERVRQLPQLLVGARHAALPARRQRHRLQRPIEELRGPAQRGQRHALVVAMHAELVFHW